MNCANEYMPMPYPEELLSSVAERYAVRLGCLKTINLSLYLCDRATRSSSQLPTSLNTTSLKTEIAWNISGEQIANDLTLYPYYTRYLSSRRRLLCLDKILSSNGHGIQLKVGLTANRIKVPYYLRYCKVCRRLDIDKYGETYWRRSHQLPGVLVCPDHGKWLLNSYVRMQLKGFSHHIDATTATANIGINLAKALDSSDKGKALLIARRSRDVILGPIPAWDGEDVSLAYRKAAIERGFIDGAVQLSLPKLEKGFAAFYGRRLLRIVQCDIPMGKNSSWFRNIFRSSHKTFHPLQHVLVQLFLESVKTRITDIIPFGLGPWKCPNPYGDHDEEFLIKDPLIYVGHKHRKYVASAKCKCGFHFTFQQVYKKDSKMPTVSKVMQYGPTWEAEARSLKNSGLSLLAIAKKLGVHDNNIKRMLQGKRRVDRVTESDIMQWRKEWLRLLKKVPERSRKYARNKNRALYLRLLRNDRAWLLSEPRRWDHRPKPPRYIDWDGRDNKWSVMLKRATGELINAIPLKRATRTAIIKEAGLGLKILSKYDRYPKCKTVLDKFSESKEDYRKRREAFRAEMNIEMAA